MRYVWRLGKEIANPKIENQLKRTSISTCTCHVTNLLRTFHIHENMFFNMHYITDVCLEKLSMSLTFWIQIQSECCTFIYKMLTPFVQLLSTWDSYFILLQTHLQAAVFGGTVSTWCRMSCTSGDLPSQRSSIRNFAQWWQQQRFSF